MEMQLGFHYRNEQKQLSHFLLQGAAPKLVFSCLLHRGRVAFQFDSSLLPLFPHRCYTQLSRHALRLTSLAEVADAELCE